MGYLCVLRVEHKNNSVGIQEILISGNVLFRLRTFSPGTTLHYSKITQMLSNLASRSNVTFTHIGFTTPLPGKWKWKLEIPSKGWGGIPSCSSMPLGLGNALIPTSQEFWEYSLFHPLNPFSCSVVSKYLHLSFASLKIILTVL